jgi:hypothetical protein
MFIVQAKFSIVEDAICMKCAYHGVLTEMPSLWLMLHSGGSTVVEHSTHNLKVKGSNPVDTERKLLAPGDRIMVKKS